MIERNARARDLGSLVVARMSPLFWTHVNPYGRFEPDMNHHLPLGPLLPQQRPPQDHAERTEDATSP